MIHSIKQHYLAAVTTHRGTRCFNDQNTIALNYACRNSSADQNFIITICRRKGHGSGDEQLVEWHRLSLGLLCIGLLALGLIFSIIWWHSWTDKLAMSQRLAEIQSVQPTLAQSIHESLAHAQIVDLVQFPDEAVNESPHSPDPIKFLAHQDHTSSSPMVIDRAELAEIGRGTELVPQESTPPTVESLSSRSAPVESQGLESEHAVSSTYGVAEDLADSVKDITKSPEMTPENNKLMTSSYASLLSSSRDMIAQSMQNHPAYVPTEEVPRGHRLSLSTTQFHHMGYFMKLKDQIESAWHFPASARSAHIFGDVKVRFQIEKSGKLSKVSILESSGHQVLDREVIRTLEIVAPFDPFPALWADHLIEITGVFSYVLK